MTTFMKDDDISADTTPEVIGLCPANTHAEEMGSARTTSSPLVMKNFIASRPFAKRGAHRQRAEEEALADKLIAKHCLRLSPLPMPDCNARHYATPNTTSYRATTGARVLSGRASRASAEDGFAA